MQVPYIDLGLQHRRLMPELVPALEAVLESGQFILGEAVDRFEAQVATYSGGAHAVGLNSGTDALILALRALDIGPGDEVITVANSFIATVSAIVLTGATPVFVDVRADYNMDPTLLNAALTSRTKAILPVHLTGRPANMKSITAFAAKHGLAVVEDCAQAIGARLFGQHVGTFGAIGCFSLHPLKNLGGCGDGGFVLTDDAALAERLRCLRNIGLKNRDECVCWSGNSRLDSIQAAIHVVKLRHLDAWNAARRVTAQRYSAALSGCVTTPVDEEGQFATYHTYVVQSERRDELQAHLQAQGIGTRVHYPIPAHKQPCAAAVAHPDLPMTEQLAGCILSLPVYPELTTMQQDYVIAHVLDFFAR